MASIAQEVLWDEGVAYVGGEHIERGRNKLHLDRTLFRALFLCCPHCFLHAHYFLNDAEIAVLLTALHQAGSHKCALLKGTRKLVKTPPFLSLSCRRHDMLCRPWTHHYGQCGEMYGANHDFVPIIVEVLTEERCEDCISAKLEETLSRGLGPAGYPHELYASYILASGMA